MGILSNISGREAVKVFKKLGYYVARQEGSHMVLNNDKEGYPILRYRNFNKQKTTESEARRYFSDTGS